MTTEQIDAVRNARPFKQFNLHLADGRFVPVNHPEMIWRTPGGRTVFVSQGGEDTTIIDLLLVTKITPGSVTANERQ